MSDIVNNPSVQTFPTNPVPAPTVDEPTPESSPTAPAPAPAPSVGEPVPGTVESDREHLAEAVVEAELDRDEAIKAWEEAEGGVPGHVAGTTALKAGPDGTPRGY